MFIIGIGHIGCVRFRFIDVIPLKQEENHFKLLSYFFYLFLHVGKKMIFDYEVQQCG